MCAKSLQLCLTLCDPMDCSEASLPMGFSRQKYWSGLPCPFPGDLPSPGIKPASPALAGRIFTTEPPGKPTDQLGWMIDSLLWGGGLFNALKGH